MVLERFTLPLAIGMAFLFYFANLSQGKANENSGVKEHEDDYICQNFSDVKEGILSFVSPNYPNHYPSRTVCTRHIVAPEGMIIQLDFREQFHIEYSDNDCEYDYLEIRDGQHGYAELIERLCGHSFPRMIYSSGRHLWLEFSSDASIQCPGFKAVYKFITAATPARGEWFKEVGGIEGVVDSKDIELKVINESMDAKRGLDCVWRIKVKPGWEISIKIEKFTLKKPNVCDVNLFEIYNRTLSSRGKKGRYCGTKAEAKPIGGNEANIRLLLSSSFWTPDMVNKKLELFSLVYTAQRKVGEGKECWEDELNCGDGYCIDKSLRCNNIENCKYKYDEENCDIAASLGEMLSSQEMITILIVFTAMVVGMCASLSVSCYTKIQKRKAKEREYRQRRSKETSVEYGIDPEGDKGLDPGKDPEIGSKRKAAKWLEDVDEDNGCYVPEVDLSVFRKQPNGGEVIPRVQETSLEPNAHPVQNRIPVKPKRPLQSPPSYSEVGNSPRSSPPPPLPPHRGRDRIIPPVAEDTLQPPRAAKPPPPARHGPISLGAAALAAADEDDEEVDPPHQIRAQAVIEAGEDGSRARSFESTKSAPDVIVNR